MATINGKVRDEFMISYRKRLLGILMMFCIFLFSSCLEVENPDSLKTTEHPSYSEDDETKKHNADEGMECSYGEAGYECYFAGIGGYAIYIDNYEDLSLHDFVNNPMLSVQENEKIKQIIIDILFYTHGFDVCYDNIIRAIDKDRSEKWFADVFASWISQASAKREGWSVADKLDDIKDFNSEFSMTLQFVQENFMLRSEFVDNHLYISVPIWQLCMISGQESGYMLYDFVFIKINDTFKLIGLSLGT